MSSYQEFLAAKARRHHSPGVTIDPADLHASLHDWQRRIVVDALARGRGAVFADTGIMTADDHRHGTNHGYCNLGCRCHDCRAAHAAYNRRIRRRKAAL